MLQALTTGWIADRNRDQTFASRANDIARRKEGITGVSEFPDVAEEPSRRIRRLDVATLRKAAMRALAKSAPQKNTHRAHIKPMHYGRISRRRGCNKAHRSGKLPAHLASTMKRPKSHRLEFRGFAEPFEQLRDASDAWHAQHGKRPAVFLANMGPVSHYTARATYSKNFFEAGGFEVVTAGGFPDADAAAKAFAASGAPVAVICSSDKLYPDLVPQLAGKLKAAGAKSVVLAGNPGTNEQAWRAAGVDRFIFVKCDVLATLGRNTSRTGRSRRSQVEYE